MLKLDLPTAPTKVVHAHEVEQLTRQGWKLVFSYQDTLLMPCNETEIDTRNNSQSYSSGLMTVTRYHPQAMTLFVLQQDPNDAYATMAGDLEVATVLGAEKVKEALALTEKLAAEKKATEQANKQAKLNEDRRNETQTELDGVRKLNRKMEGELAKIRAAVGDLAIKKILD